MKADLKYLHSPDILDLKKHSPRESDNFGFLLQMIVGQEGESEDGESFDIFVCTPKWLLQNKIETDIIVGLHYLIMFEYSYERLYHRLNDIVKKVQGKSWQELGMKLNKIGKWEFEDYSDN